jgi:hypothetical protein
MLTIALASVLLATVAADIDCTFRTKTQPFKFEVINNSTSKVKVRTCDK